MTEARPSAVADGDHPTLAVELLGIEVWSDFSPDWAHLRDLVLGAAAPRSEAALRPMPDLLSAAERRRVPELVALSLHVGARAVKASGVDARALPSVFASCHGDLATTDHLCDTLARDPRSVSPTRFIQSVHNTVAGYWGMATGSVAPSMALAGGTHTFASGLLEASMQAVVLDGAVLFVACDLPATGTLAQLTSSQGRLAVGLVLRPSRGPAADATFHATQGAAVRPMTLRVEAWSEARQASTQTGAVLRHLGIDHNALADALPWLAAAAQPGSSVVALPLGAGRQLTIGMQPWRAERATTAEKPN